MLSLQFRQSLVDSKADATAVFLTHVLFQSVVPLFHNFPAICLSMYEQASIPTDYRKLYLVLTPEFDKPVISELRPNSSVATLEEQISAMRQDRPNDSSFQPKKHCLLLYQKDPTDDGTHAQGLMDSLFPLANFGPRESPASRQKKKKSRPSERGFQGTLLHASSSAQPVVVNIGDKDKEEKEKAVSTVSEDEGKQHPSQQPSIVVDDSSPASSRPSSVAEKRQIPSDDDEEDSVVEIAPPKKIPKVAPQVPDVLDGSSDGDQQADLSSLVIDKLEQAVENPSANMSKIWDSAFFAIQKNPGEKDANTLRDIALAKYLSH